MESELQNFDLEQIAASGQCFRMCSTVNGGMRMRGADAV